MGQWVCFNNIFELYKTFGITFYNLFGPSRSTLLDSRILRFGSTLFRFPRPVCHPRIVENFAHLYAQHRIGFEHFVDQILQCLRRAREFPVSRQLLAELLFEIVGKGQCIVEHDVQTDAQTPYIVIEWVVCFSVWKAKLFLFLSEWSL